MKSLLIALCLLVSGVAHAGTLAQCKIAMHSLAKKYPKVTIEFVGGYGGLWIREMPKDELFTADRDTVFSVCLKQGLHMLFINGSGQQPSTDCTVHMNDGVEYNCQKSDTPLKAGTPRVNMKD